MINDMDICICGHESREHINFVKSKQRPGYREVRGKNRYGSCGYMRGIPGHFCSCKKFIPAT